MASSSESQDKEVAASSTESKQSEEKTTTSASNLETQTLASLNEAVNKAESAVATNETAAAVSDEESTAAKNLEVDLSATGANAGESVQSVADADSLHATADSLSTMNQVTNSLEAAYATDSTRKAQFVTRVMPITAFAASSGTDQNIPLFDISEAIYKPGTDMQKQGYQGKAWLYRDGTLAGTNDNSKQ